MAWPYEKVNLQVNVTATSDKLSGMRLDPSRAYRFPIPEADHLVGYEPGKVTVAIENDSAFDQASGAWAVVLGKDQRSLVLE